MKHNLRERLFFSWLSVQHKRSLRSQIRWQERYVQRLLHHASQNVPVWSQLLRENSIDPFSIRSILDLARLPSTSKRFFLGKMPEQYIDNSRRSRKAHWYVTSGTSGIPFTFLMSEHATDATYIDFGSLRFLWWRGEGFETMSTINMARIKIRAQNSAHRFFTSVEDFQTDPHAALAKIARFKPEILSTYPSLLLEIARLTQSDPSFPRLGARFALSFGETLTPSIRSFITDTLSLEVYDRYGLEEVGAVGVECRLHDGFHINTESVIVEVTDESFRPIMQGKEGRVVITDLFNYGMPFIRYDTGDSGRISYEPCECGLESPRLWVKGRYSAYLSFPTRTIHHLEFDGAMDSFMHAVYQYQIVKLSDERVSARIIAGPAFSDTIEQRIIQNLRALLGPSIHIQVEQVPILSSTPRGKSRIVVDESKI
jgi:phenylacetate-CoA ligase